MNKIPGQSLQDVAERVDRAYTLFFNNVRRKVRTSPPQFQSPGRYRSYTLKQCGYKFLSGNVVQFGRKKYRCFKSREFEGKVKTAAVKRNQCGNCWPIVATDQKRVLNKPGSGSVVGFDFGMKTFLVGSGKTAIDLPLVFRNALSKIRRLHRVLSRRKRFSGNWKKAKARLAKCRRALGNRHDHFQWTPCRWLLERHDTLVFEDLNSSACQSGLAGKSTTLALPVF